MKLENGSERVWLLTDTCKFTVSIWFALVSSTQDSGARTTFNPNI